MWIDITIVALLLIGIFLGFKKGFIIEMAMLIGLIAGLVAAIYLSKITSNYLHKYFDTVYPEIAFAVTFLVVLLFVYIIGKGVETVVNAAAAGIINRIFGAIFGLVKWAFISSVLVFFFDRINTKKNWISAADIAESHLYTPIQQVTEVCIPPILELKQDVE
jgi:membrane protein required for colicin V production